MNEINPVEYGKLVNSVDNLERKVDAMEVDIKKLVAMAERSKGSLWALMGVTSEWVSSSRVKCSLSCIFFLRFHIHDLLQSTTPEIEGHN